MFSFKGFVKMFVVVSMVSQVSSLALAESAPISPNVKYILDNAKALKSIDQLRSYTAALSVSERRELLALMIDVVAQDEKALADFQTAKARGENIKEVALCLGIGSAITTLPFMAIAIAIGGLKNGSMSARGVGAGVMVSGVMAAISMVSLGARVYAGHRVNVNEKEAKHIQAKLAEAKAYVQNLSQSLAKSEQLLN